MSDVIPPPPPPRRNDSGCWKWGAITCLGLGCIGAIAFVAIIAFVMRTPMFKQAMTTMQDATVIQRDMRVVKQALDRYAADKGKYPANLRQLIPTYLPDDRSLRLSTRPNGPEFQYTPPSKNAPGSFVILRYELPAPVPSPGAPPWIISMTKDGTFEGMEYRYEQGGRTYRIPGNTEPQ